MNIWPRIRKGGGQESGIRTHICVFYLISLKQGETGKIPFWNTRHLMPASYLLACHQRPADSDPTPLQTSYISQATAFMFFHLPWRWGDVYQGAACGQHTPGPGWGKANLRPAESNPFSSYKWQMCSLTHLMCIYLLLNDAPKKIVPKKKNRVNTFTIHHPKKHTLLLQPCTSADILRTLRDIADKDAAVASLIETWKEKTRQGASVLPFWLVQKTSHKIFFWNVAFQKA